MIQRWFDETCVYIQIHKRLNRNTQSYRFIHNTLRHNQGHTHHTLPLTHTLPASLNTLTNCLLPLIKYHLFCASDLLLCMCVFMFNLCVCVCACKLHICASHISVFAQICTLVYIGVSLCCLCCNVALCFHRSHRAHLYCVCACACVCVCVCVRWGLIQSCSICSLWRACCYSENIHSPNLQSPPDIMNLYKKIWSDSNRSCLSPESV